MFTISLKYKQSEVFRSPVVLIAGLLLFFFTCSSFAVEYESLCGYIVDASQHCDNLSGKCTGKMVITDVCQYSFYKILIPYGVKYLKISFWNKNLYKRNSCREVKVAVRMDNDYLNMEDVRYKNVVFYDDLRNGDTFILRDLKQVYVSIKGSDMEENKGFGPIGGGDSAHKSHVLYVGTLTHVDEIEITFVISQSNLRYAGCYGDESTHLEGGCPGEVECGGVLSSLDEKSAFTGLRWFFWNREKLECMPGNLSGCKSQEECEDVGGYWIDEKCLSAVPFVSATLTCDTHCVGQRLLPYFCADKSEYDIGDEVDLYVHVPDFDKDVDIYLGILKPDGSLDIFYKREGEVKRKTVEKTNDLVPFKEGIDSEFTFDLSLSTALVSFSGDYIRLMDQGEYVLYMLLVPSRNVSLKNWILTECRFYIK